jgi:porin
MRVPTLRYSLPLLFLLPATLHAQEMSDGDSFATLPLEDVIPSVRPETPRAATQPTTAPSPEEQKSYLLDDPWGARTWLIDHGITAGAKLTLDYGKNVLGGRTTHGSAFNTLFNFSLSLDTEKLANLPGGTAYFNFQQQHGTSASDEAGNLQNVENTTADGRTQLSEAWYQQALLDKKWLIKAGKIDAGADFAFSDFAADFNNAVMALPLTNSLLPTYPNSAFGLDTFVYPTDHLYLAFGAFDGALAQGVQTGENGPHSLFHAPDNTYLIAEAGVTWQVTPSKLSGRLKLGAWYETDDVPTFSGGTRDGAWGPYLTLDQKLIRFNPADDNDDRGLGFFLLLNHTDASDAFPATDQLAAGFSVRGPLPTRDADTLGLGVTYADLTDDHAAGLSHGSETAIETFYKVQLTPYLTIKPDLQYILDPAFTDSSNALVAALRVELTF